MGTGKQDGGKGKTGNNYCNCEAIGVGRVVSTHARDVNITLASTLSLLVEQTHSFIASRSKAARLATHKKFPSFFASGLMSESSRLLQLILAGSDL
jgi:hypothetical protein